MHMPWRESPAHLHLALLHPQEGRAGHRAVVPVQRQHRVHGQALDLPRPKVRAEQAPLLLPPGRILRCVADLKDCSLGSIALAWQSGPVTSVVVDAHR